ncbi:MAG TPA: hypothetical protein VFA32_22630 [Dehalococcoidia bacterium]|nr:hypothetical protein [Dehalococcoidia bacterium]
MGGAKETYQLSLNPDHLAFIRPAREKYDLAKVMRIIMDYVMTTPGIHDAVFNEVRCLHCE